VTASEKALQVARDHAVAEKKALDAGTGTSLAVLRADAELVRRESDLVKAQADLERAQLALGVLLGTGEPVRVTVTPPDAADLDVEALAKEAHAARPELKARAAAVTAQERQAESVKMRFAPQLSATASALASSVELPTGDKTAWKVSVDLVWPLYDGGFRYGRRDQVAAALDEAQQDVRAAQLDIDHEVADAVRDLQVARNRLRMAERQRALAAEAAASAKRGFEGGIAGSLEVVDANDRLYAADLGLAAARAQAGAAWVAVQLAAGRAL
jgi:outer membrane protein TolC